MSQNPDQSTPDVNAFRNYGAEVGETVNAVHQLVSDVSCYKIGEAVPLSLGGTSPFLGLLVYASDATKELRNAGTFEGDMWKEVDKRKSHRAVGFYPKFSRRPFCSSILLVVWSPMGPNRKFLFIDLSKIAENQSRPVDPGAQAKADPRAPPSSRTPLRTKRPPYCSPGLPTSPRQSHHLVRLLSCRPGQ